MIRFRWKRLLIPAALAGILFVAPDDSLGQRGGFGGGGGGQPGGQPGGGGGFGGGGQPGGGGGRGGFNMGSIADGQFDQLVRSTGGSGETLDYSKIPPDIREQTNRRSQMFGAPPLPASGTVSKADFRAEVEKRMAARTGGMAPGGTAPGATPTTGGGDKVVVLGGPGGPTDGKTMTMTMQPGGGMTMQPGGGGFGGGGGGQTAESRFKEMDRNQDGRISREEAQNGSKYLTRSFDQSDTNKDGVIDSAEYTVYYTAITGGGGGGGSSGWGGGGSREERKLEEPDEPKPVVYRFGHLPQGLPAYFTDADSDKDGQIGLYEWVKYWDTSEVRLTEFKGLDQNGDGLLTAEEYMRVKKVTPAQLAQAGNGNGRGRGPGDTSVAQPPAEGTPSVSQGTEQDNQQKKDDRSRDTSKDPRKEEKKEEKKDPRSSGDTRGTSGDTRGQGGSRFGTPPGGGTTPGGTTPGGTPPTGGFGGRGTGGGGSPFNPGGGGGTTPPGGGGRPGGGR